MSATKAIFIGYLGALSLVVGAILLIGLVGR